jgi:integrase
LNAVDVRRLPNPAAVVKIIDALHSHQPGSRTYQAMTAVVAYAGLRPSEVVMLRPRALHLPATGWGTIAVTEADVALDEPGDPKTGNRTTPIPPRLVELLRAWIDEHDLSNEELLFRTRMGNRPSRSNWARALKRACANAGHHRIRVYDFRHTHATVIIRSQCRNPGVDLHRRDGGRRPRSQCTDGGHAGDHSRTDRRSERGPRDESRKFSSAIPGLNSQGRSGPRSSRRCSGSRAVTA